MTRSPLLVLALVVPLLLGAPPAAATADGAQALAGETRLSASESGYVRVHVPVALTIDASNSGEGMAQVEVHGGNLLAGLMLRREQSDSGAAPAFFAFRASNEPFCGDRCGEAPVSVVGFSDDQPSNSSWRLPSGDYRLYAIGDGPVTATLRVPGLAGALALAPETRTHFEAADLPRIDGNPLGNVAIFAGAGNLQSDGMLFTQIAAVSEPRAGGRDEVCTYEEGVAAAQAFAFHPTCPDADASISAGPGFTSLGPVASGLYMGVQGYGAGRYRVGGNISSAGVVTGVGGIGAWISFDGSSPTPRSQPETPPAPTTGPPASTPPAVDAGGGASGRLRLEGKGRYRVRRGSVSIPLRCGGTTACRGTARLSGARARSFAIAPGKKARLRLAVPRRARRQATLRIQWRDGDAEHTLSRRISLRR